MSPTWWRKDKSTLFHFFLDRLLGGLPCTSQVSCNGLPLKKSGNLFIRTYLPHARAPSVRMKECPGALAAKMLLMKSVHQVLSGFWIQLLSTSWGEKWATKRCPVSRKAIKYQWYCGPSESNAVEQVWK